MVDFFGFFGSIFGYLLYGCYWLVNNFGVAIILFTLIVRIVMFPMNIKQQKSMAGNARLQAKQQELREKYGNDKQRYNEEISKLYSKEGVNPMGGCLTTLVPVFLMLGVFYAVAYPLTNTLHLDAATINKIMYVPGLSMSANSAYQQIEFIKHFHAVSDTAFIQGLFSPEQIGAIDSFAQSFNFLGLDLLATPKDFGFSVLLLIPGLCFVTSVGSQFFMMRMKGNPMQQQQGCMKWMLLAMPLISVYFSYIVPAAVGFYWICSTVIGFLQSVIINKFYSPVVLTAKAEAQHVALMELEEAQVKYEYNPVTKNKKK